MSNPDPLVAPVVGGTPERMFPIQNVGLIPWSLAERAYAVYAGRNRNEQSLERLAERGGFGLAELGWLLGGAIRSEPDHDHHRDCERAAKEILAALVPRPEPPIDGIRFDVETNTYVARHTVLTAARTEEEAKLALASAIRLTADYWPPRPEPRDDIVKSIIETLWAEIPLHRKAQMMADGFSLDPFYASIARRPEPREPEPPICTFCARGVPGFQLQSGTGNLWHRNEAGQLFKCVGGPTAAVRSASAPSLEQVIAQKDAAYAERDQLVAALSKLWPSHLARHPDEDTMWENDWRWIVCIHSPVGQLTWHIHDSEREQFDHLDALRGDWDGHTTEEKYARLKSLAVSAPSRPLEEQEEPEDVALKVEVIREYDGRFAASWERGNEGGMAAYSGTVVGALAELCASLIRVDEDNAHAPLRVLVPGGDPRLEK